MTTSASGRWTSVPGWVGTGRSPARGNPRMLAAAGTTVAGLLEQRVKSLTSLPRNTLRMTKGTSSGAHLETLPLPRTAGHGNTGGTPEPGRGSALQANWHKVRAH